MVEQYVFVGWYVVEVVVVFDCWCYLQFVELYDFVGDEMVVEVICDQIYVDCGDYDLEGIDVFVVCECDCVECECVEQCDCDLEQGIGSLIYGVFWFLMCF